MTKLKVLCVLFDDPSNKSTTFRDSIPKLQGYPGGTTLPTPNSIDFNPGELLGNISGELGLRSYIEGLGHEFIVTSDKDGENSVFEKELIDADIVISQPFWPAYLTPDRIAKAKKLKLAITAGIGSDHVDLDAAMANNITVCEVSYSNSISVAEHAVMMILSLVRNYIPQYKQVVEGKWNIADCVQNSYDLEGMTVGVVGSGRIGLAVMRRLNPFDVKLCYTDNYRLSSNIEEELNLTYFDSVDLLVANCDVISLHCPLYKETENLFDKELLNKMKPGSYLINTARGKLCNTNDIKEALESGHLSGYAGDVWFPQPAPSDHPWRHMPNHGMTPHTSGATISAQARYSAGVREILECWFSGTDIRKEYLIVENGILAGSGAHSYQKNKKEECSAK